MQALTAPGCPPKYEAVRQHPYSADQLAAAQQGKFKLSDKPFPAKEIRPGIDWTQDPYKSKAWRKAFHTLAYLDSLFFIYGDTTGHTPAQQVAALAQARDLALDWITSNPKGGAGVDPRAWTNKVVADRGPYVAYLGRAAACAGLLTPAQADILLASIEKHARYLAQDGHYNPSNHGLFMDLGLGLLANYLPTDPLSAKWKSVSRGRFFSTFTRRVNPAEGVWLEHSTGYQTVALTVLERYVDFVAPNDAMLKALIAKMVDVSGWFLMPDGTKPQFGDTELRAPRGEAVTAAADDDGMKVYPDAGFAIVKDRSINGYFAITAGFHSYAAKGFAGISHKHADDLSFDLYEQGRRIVSDTGVYNKDDNDYRAFGRSAIAHSVLTADGQDFDLANSKPYGSGILAWGEGEGWYAVLARNPILKGQNVKHRRLFLYKPGYGLIVVDDARSPQGHTYDRYFQIGPGIKATEAGKKVKLSRPGFLSRLTDDRTRDNTKRLLVRGQNDPLEGYTFPSFRQKRPRWTIDYRTKTDDLLGVATFALNPAQPIRAIAPPGSNGMSLSIRGPRVPPTTLNIARGGQQLVVSQTP
ncbi:MAG: hypothetical protein QOG62_312 [Thermoleophilaceae bacterium]|nr:hypothetical protein [Thermoleophilaceae bacterium]